MTKILHLYLIAITIQCVSCRPSSTSSVAITNFTVPVPEGTSNHGDPGIICTPTRWYEIIAFFITNYIAHAFTVKTIPGERLETRMVTVILALLFPFSGVARGLESILRPAKIFPYSSDELEIAARSGALCVVVRKDSWKPRPGIKIQGAMICESDTSPASDQDKKLNIEAASKDYCPNCTCKPNDLRGKLVEIGVQPNDEDKTRYMADHDDPDRDDPDRDDPDRGDPDRDDPDRDDPDRDEKSHGSVRMHVLSLWGKLVHFEGKVFSKQPHFSRTTLAKVEKDRIIHGHVHFPEDFGYELMILPKDAVVVWNVDPAYLKLKGKNHFASSYNAMQVVVAIIQLFSAILTLYRTRGDQLRRYGGAAFGLTVIQYLIMTVVNAIGRLMTPEYPALYLVSSPEMNDAKAEGAFFDGVIGKIKEHPASKRRISGLESVGYRKVNVEFLRPSADDRNEDIDVTITTACGDQYSKTWSRQCGRTYVEKPCHPIELGHEWEKTPRCPNHKIELSVPSCVDFERRSTGISHNNYRLVRLFIILLLGALPFAAIGGTTRFQPGQSTTAERVLTLFWLVSGTVIGTLAAWSKPIDQERLRILTKVWTNLDTWADVFDYYPKWFIFLSLLVFLPSVVGGFVVVGIMLHNYGTCNLV